LHRATIAHKECGWKGGDRGGLAEWEQFGKRRNKEEERKKRQNERKDLTLTGLLMEGISIISRIARYSVSAVA
jgi:hypothetical protein